MAEGARTIKQTANITETFKGLLNSGSYNLITLGTAEGMGEGNTLIIDGQNYKIYAFSGLVDGKVAMYDGVTIQNSGYYGIDPDSGSSIHGGVIKNSASYGIHIDISIDIEGCIIEGNKGDGIYIDEASTVNIKPGTKIYGNSGSGIKLDDFGNTLNMTGGEIYGNGNGGISANNYPFSGSKTNTISLTGGKIYGNKAYSYGGAVTVNQYNLLTLGGSIEIYDNFSNGTKNTETGLYEGTTQRNLCFVVNTSGNTPNVLSFARLSSKLTGEQGVGLCGDSSHIVIDTTLVKSDGAYTITEADLAKFSWDMTGSSARGLELSGADTSAVIKLVEGLKAPTISTQPAASTTVTFGAVSGSLSVAASGNAGAALSYQWQQKDSEGKWSDIANAKAESFTLPTDLGAGSYSYRCVVTATKGTAKQSASSDEAAVTVDKADMPKITVTGYNSTYDGKSHPAFAITGAPEGYTVKSGLSANTLTSDILSAQNASSDTKVFYEISHDNYKTVTGNVTYTISQKQLTVTDTAVTPTPEVKFGKTTLVSGTDFDYGYSDNTAIGTTAKVTVTFKCNFSGSGEKTFSIVAAGLPGNKTNADYFTMPDANGAGWYNGNIVLTPVNGVTVGTASNATGGVTITEESATGSQTVFIKDAQGKIYQTSVSYKLDKTAPVITDVTGNPTAWQKADVTLSVSGAADTLSGLAEQPYSFDGGATWQSGNTKIYNANASGIVIKVKDAAGNVYSHDAIDITKIDKTAPGITITPEITAGKWYGATEFTAQTNDGTGSGEVKVTVKQGKNDVNFAGGKFIATESVANSYTYTITATDAVGNSASDSVTLQIDTRIDEFMSRIDTLGYTPSYSKLTEVKGWYDSQSALVQSHIKTNDDAKAALNKLMEDFAAAAENAASGVETAIDDAKTIEAIQAAKRDYDALPDDVKSVIPADKVKKLNQKAADAETASLVKRLLADGVKSGASYDDKKIAVELYDRLTDTQKALIPDSESDYNALKPQVDAMDAVVAEIDAVKAPYTPNSKALISKANGAFSGLDSDLKGIFPTDKKAALDEKLAMLGRVEAVETLITGLKTPYDSANNDAIKAAKTAFDALSADEKAMTDGELKSKLNQLYNAMLAGLSQDERLAAEAAGDFAARVAAVAREPGIGAIEALETAYSGLSDDAKASLTTELVENYNKLVADKNAAKPVAKALDAISAENIGTQAATDTLADYNKLSDAQKTLVNKVTSNKAAAISEAMAVLEHIGKIPVHADGSEIGTDCSDHSAASHKTAVEAARAALDKLPQDAKALMPEDKITLVQSEYTALLGYLEYISRDTTAKTVVEVVGLTNKMGLPNDAATAGKTVLAVEAEDAEPILKPLAPAGKSQLMCVSISVKAYLYADANAVHGQDVPTSVETVQPSQAVLVKLKVPTGYKLDTLEIWHVKNNGQRVRVNDFQLVSETDGTYAVFETDSFSHFMLFARQTSAIGSADTVTKPGKKLPFTDVSENDWFYADVKYMHENGHMQGTATDKFSPARTTTRGMIVTILYRLEGTPGVTGVNSFDDVPAGQYYTDAVLWAAANQIVDGYGNGKFGPNDNITREQMAAILYRYARFKGYDVTAVSELTGFTDVTSVSGYALTAMSWANANSLINGKSNGVLDPRGEAKRCEVAAIFHRFCENMAAK